MLLHTGAFTQRPFRVTDPFTHRCFYTQTLLHRDTFTSQTCLHTGAFTHNVQSSTFSWCLLRVFAVKSCIQAPSYGLRGSTFISTISHKYPVKTSMNMVSHSMPGSTFFYDLLCVYAVIEYTHNSDTFTQKVITHKSLYPQKLLHTDVFTHRPF